MVLAPDEEIELRARLHLDETKIPPNCREEPKTLRFNLHAFVSTQDSWLPFGGITGNVHPSYRSKLKLIGIERARNREDIVVKGILQGPHRAPQPLDVALVASNGMTYEGTASTNSTGRFEVPITTRPADRRA